MPCRDQDTQILSVNCHPSLWDDLAMLGRGHFHLSTGLAQGTLNRLSLQKGEKINVAVKTCKKDCTLDNKEKFLSEAGGCPLGSDAAPI